MLAVQENELKEGDILLSDTIANFKTVASISNMHILVQKHDAICEKRIILGVKEANCEGI